MYTNHSLKYHYWPEKGWINDPNGLSFYKGYYHIFYQHIPGREYPGHDKEIWGHARTKDFLHFEELPVAMDGDRDYDINGVWSGTAIEKDGKLYAFYASIDGNGRQTVSVAWSDDGINFTKYSGNPVISEHPCNTGGNFRDPAVMACGSEYYLAVASADADRKTGVLFLYRSSDLLHWEYKGILHEYEDSRWCECPSFLPYGDGFILATSVGKFDGSHYFEVMYGTFDGTKFTPEVTSHFQKGPDEYAGQIFRAPDGRAILISWIPGWNYQPKEKCIGCMSLPLEITVERGIMRAYPVEEVRQLLDENGTLTDAYVTERFVNRGEEVYINISEDAAKECRTN